MKRAYKIKRGTNYRSIIAFCGLVASLGNCNRTDKDPTPSTLQVERETDGDVTVVRTLSGSIWGSAMILVEDLRIGTDDPMLGSVDATAVDSMGGVYVFDSKGPVLMYYDSTGKFLRTIGRKGSGPGEYGERIDGMAVRHDGRLIVRDGYNGRLTLYEPTGVASDHWPLGSQLSAPRSLVLGAADHLYLRILWRDPQPGAVWEFGLLHLDQEGRFIDSLQVPSVAGDKHQLRPGPFRPSKVWAFSPFGYFVVGVNDRYRFELVPRTGSRVRVERLVEQVQLRREERAEWDSMIHWGKSRLPPEAQAALPSVPRTKPAYRAFGFGTDRRIWVLRHVNAVKDSTFAWARSAQQPPTVTWHEPEVWDVFQENGDYMGEVHAPPRTSLMLFGPERVWGVQYDGQSSYVVRFRIEPAGGSRSH